MIAHTFAPGFRLSVLDVIILLIGIISACVLAMLVWWWGFVLAFVLGHFFLFCNVIRMSRPLELIWGGAFVAMAAPTVAADVPGWAVTILVALAVTVAVVLVQARKPSYHGVGWSWINPGLPEWWESQAQRADGL